MLTDLMKVAFIDIHFKFMANIYASGIQEGHLLTYLNAI